ncbi:uncharacterized protein Nmag_3171 [Natrialba magadii ATCC 43099]|uniref:Uncharacterized protein n=1 Tax=Natrialba magadii (strain ATCC 43099 / DSM 3394 / CCM 3739 / CIP 104546 / IAM 13178 / JCM 8861 / NBRC 102185 / NCIMB 2190 / MS3) TaxID=547559 RepID=D3SRU9_NATMM|nr:hypothetical protein [Natrialba magadii]ADD06723.1 uncharacterized protein Nmag_3171 [Natrialba magadii ATCC 43099]ELY32133.1 hypothetical protein C500_04543 [Natrialba magadii ATCC 43099]
MSDTGDLQERVTEILETADIEAGALVEADDTPSGEAISEAAADANALLESAEPREILEAVGLGTLPDGSEPESLPAAIAQGDPEHVAELERLLRLSGLADSADEETMDEAIGGLREAISEHRAADADADADMEADDGEDESESEPESEADDDSDVLESVESELGTALRDRVSSFGDDVDGLQEKLASVGGESEDDGVVDEVSDGDGDGDGDGDRDHEESATEDDDELFDERLEADIDPDLDPDLGSDTESGSDDGKSSRGVVRHSTLAPSPSKRADMKSPARFSTMPKKDE